MVGDNNESTGSGDGRNKREGSQDMRGVVWGGLVAVDDGGERGGLAARRRRREETAEKRHRERVGDTWLCGGERKPRMVAPAMGGDNCG